MAKTKKDRPAINGFWLLNLIRDNKIKVAFLDQLCPVMILLEGIRIRQHWLIKTKSGKIIAKSERTYLRKGIFLSPIWQNVADWKIAYYQENGIDLSPLGIFCFEENYCCLTYMQIDRLDAAYRQPLHVLDEYFEKEKEYPSDLADVYGELLKIGRITMITKNRFIRIRRFSKVFLDNLSKNRRKIENILNKDHLSRYQDIAVMLQIIDYCRAIKSRPMYRRLYYASRSLELAIKYIKDSNFKRAKARMRSALKNLTYPKPKPKTP